MARMSHWNPTRPIMEMQSVLFSGVANHAVLLLIESESFQQAEIYAMEEEM